MLSRGEDNCSVLCDWCVFFFQAEDGIRDLVRSRGLGDVYKRQDQDAELDRDGDSRKGRHPDDHRIETRHAEVIKKLSLIHI